MINAWLRSYFIHMIVANSTVSIVGGAVCSLCRTVVINLKRAVKQICEVISSDDVEFYMQHRHKLIQSYCVAS